MELIVALFIFSIVMVVAIGSIVSALDANRKAQSLESVMNNLNLAMDEMTKSLAVGKEYSCAGGGDCPLSGGSPSKTLSFFSQEGDVVTYEFKEVVSGSGRGYITRKIGTGSAPELRLTATEINIDFTKSGFYVEGTGRFSVGDVVQPRVFIVIAGTAQAGPRNSTSFVVQTSVSQRTPDFNS